MIEMVSFSIVDREGRSIGAIAQAGQAYTLVFHAPEYSGQIVRYEFFDVDTGEVIASGWGTEGLSPPDAGLRRLWDMPARNVRLGARLTSPAQAESGTRLLVAVDRFNNPLDPGVGDERVTTPPPPPPKAPPEIYILDIETQLRGYHPEIPGWMVEKLRSWLEKGGWGLNYVSRTGEGYEFGLEKLGSVTLTIVMVIVAAVLALIGLKIITATMTRLSDNETNQVQAESVSENVNKILSLGLPADETAVLLGAVDDLYGTAITTPPPSTGGTGLLGSMEPFLWAALAISLIGAIRK